MISEIRRTQGVDLDQITDAEAQQLVQAGWRYGNPAPPGFHYNEDGVLVHKRPTVWDRVGQYAPLAVATAATIASGGAASPWMMAATGGITGAASAGINGGDYKDMLRAGLVGGATGGLGAGIANSGLNTGQQIAAQGALGAGAGAAQNGQKGAFIGGLTGAGSAAAGQIAKTQAGSGASRTQQLMTQAGIQSALGGATGGVPGALLGAGQGAANNAIYQQKFKRYQQQQRTK